MLIKEITEQQAEEADPAFQLKQQTPMSDLERERLASFQLSNSKTKNKDNKEEQGSTE